MAENNLCDSKMKFDTKKEAESTAAAAAYQRGSKLKVYRCRHCGLWHLSSSYDEA